MTSRVAAQRRRRLAIRLTGAALAWSVGVLVSALWLPVYANQTIVDSNGITLATATYVQRNGAWVLIPIALPAVASLAVALALARPEHPAAHWAWRSIVAVWAVGLVTVLNAGGLLLPTAVLLSLAARLDRRPDRARIGRPADPAAPPAPPP